MTSVPGVAFAGAGGGALEAGGDTVDGPTQLREQDPCGPNRHAREKDKQQAGYDADSIQPDFERSGACSYVSVL